MKQPWDTKTVDLFEAKRGRGRPVAGNAKSDADRAREYRARKKAAQEARKASPRPQSTIIDLSRCWNSKRPQNDDTEV